jgi:hypothetical protein
MNNNRIREISSSLNTQTKGLDLLENRTMVGSLSEDNEYSSDEMERFWFNSRNIRESIVTRHELFSGKMLSPKAEKVLLTKPMLDLMVEYYTATYETHNFKAPFDDGPVDLIIISRITINKFGRCRIGSEVFGSTMASRHVKVRLFWQNL